jgi:hypothetical protein
MNQKKTLILAAAALLVLAAGVFLSLRHSGEQASLGGTEVFADLEKSLGEITEIRLSKGDGSRATLRKADGGWQVAERQYPANGTRVRELALGLANLRVVERKTQDPANYPKLGVEATDTPTATGTLVEVVAGKKTWSLIVGKGAGGRGVYARKPAEAVSFLAAPLVAADPDQKRWIDRLIVDLPGSNVHEISVQIGRQPAYLLRRPQRDATELTLTPVPKGRKAASGVVLGGQAEALSGFNFDDLRTLPDDPAPAATDTATYRLFDGQVFEFKGRRDGDKAYITVNAHRDAALAAKFAPSPASAVPAAPAKPDSANPESTSPAPASAVPAPPAPPDQSVERLSARAKGLEFEIPVYKYEAIFKPHEQLLEPKQ